MKNALRKCQARRYLQRFSFAPKPICSVLRVRRRFSCTALFVLAWFASSFTAPAVATPANELVFAAWGGAYQDAVRAAWLTPFEQTENVSVLEDTGPSLAKIRAMEDTGNLSWDVVATSGASFAMASKLDLFEPLNALDIDQNNMLSKARSRYGVPSEIYATLLGYLKTAYPNNPPQTFADFWDERRFPGPRILPALPTGILEIALLADGVRRKDVYPMLSTDRGMERALDKIRAIRPYVAFWWSSAAQAVQGLASGDGVMAIGWNGRFQDGIDAGLPIEMSWSQSLMEVGYFAVLHNAPHKAAALALLRYISTQDAQSRLSHYIAYGPTRADAFARIPDQQRSRLPSTPDRLSHALFIDNDWWAQHGAKATQMYMSVMQGN